jgi:nicotinamidase-related amidase
LTSAAVAGGVSDSHQPNAILCKGDTILDQDRAIICLAPEGYQGREYDMLMDRGRSQLLLIDIQDRLAPHVAGGEMVTANCARLAHYARRLDIPVTLTEHYPEGLGRTAPMVLAALGHETQALVKIAFSSWQEPAIRARIEGLRNEGRTQVVVAGMEANVCVGQTSLDLIAAGLEVFLVADAVGSRVVPVRDLAIRRLERAGANIVTHEMVAFEWLGRSDTRKFKDLIEVIK